MENRWVERYFKRYLKTVVKCKNQNQQVPIHLNIMIHWHHQTGYSLLYAFILLDVSKCTIITFHNFKHVLLAFVGYEAILLINKHLKTFVNCCVSSIIFIYYLPEFFRAHILVFRDILSCYLADFFRAHVLFFRNFLFYSLYDFFWAYVLFFRDKRRFGLKTVLTYHIST